MKVCSLQSFQEALPLLTGPNPPHLIFTRPELPDGIWAGDVVSLAHKAARPVNVIVVGRLANMGLTCKRSTGARLTLLLLPSPVTLLTHVLRCAIENVLSRRETQVHPA